ncbi:chorismate dehydratase [Maridesulfovibrio ferrireducens]|uniref:Chorismate dehydratase n=1 Tax=Maridesulfovibrio ferrireducens TaxID=246191 RepID=A0A1G9F5H7_9BACT|nr:menaquinone biosynthesis protein [Maridesulfovibrio ferrireducens]SDK83580.1 chorismate dehydratase [Maridesulfovibrio ferrireducens]
MFEEIKVGRISYLNVLPIYYPLESKLIENNFNFFYGPPAQLNKLMAEGLLHISSTSSIEYLRHAEQYELVPDIAIGSCGPVQSVLLISRKPIAEMKGCKILVSSQTHTSAALLEILLTEYIPVNPQYETGNATELLEAGERPEAILAIGDEALNLRHHEDYPYKLDLGEAWREWTGLPFIFGVWLVRKDVADKPEIKEAVRTLIKGKEWGQSNIDRMSEITAEKSILSPDEMKSYFEGLVYNLKEKEIEGLKVFAKYLQKKGQISQVPELNFIKI